jgi:hypothetical protein
MSNMGERASGLSRSFAVMCFSRFDLPPTSFAQMAHRLEFLLKSAAMNALRQPSISARVFALIMSV